MRAVLQQAEQQIVRERKQAAPVSPWQLLADVLRNAVAFAALAIGFAALAQRPGQPITLLREWQFRRRLRLQRRLRRRAATGTDQEFVRQRIGQADQR